MNNTKYTEIVESLYNSIEETLDHMMEQQNTPIDYENSSGVITINCEDTETEVIISRQQASQQIWVAAKSGGFHFDHNGKVWQCSKTNESLQNLLSRVCTEQSNNEIVFNGVD